MKHLLRYIIGLAVLVSFASCERRELTYYYYPYHDIEIHIDWSKFKGEKPTGVSAWVYKQGSDKPLQFRSSNVDHIKVYAPKGTNEIVVFNQIPIDFGTIDFRNIDLLSTFQVFATTEENHVWYKRPDTELVLRQPEAFATDIYRDFLVTQEMVDSTMNILAKNKEDRDNGIIPTDTVRVTHITLTPTMATKRVKVKVGVKGIHNLLSLRAAIKQMSAGYNIDEHCENGEQSTSVLTEWKSSGGYGNGYVTTEYDVFGFAEEVSSKTFDYANWNGWIYIEALLVDNKTIKTFNIPIDGKTLVSLIGGEIDILIDISKDEDKDIVLPDVKPEGGSDGGFNAEVEDWDKEENVEIPL